MNGKTLRAVRNYKGLTQEEFSRELGVSTPYLCLIESGKRNISDNIRMKVAQLFEVDETFIATMENLKSFDEL